VPREFIEDLPSPHPLGAHLPAVYQVKDPFTMGLAAACDEILAPIIGSLDNFDSYLDPALTPIDFLQWLGTWVGLALDESWTPERRRAFVAEASALYKVRGTLGGLRAYLELLTGGEVRVEDSGGIAWSTESGSPFPGRPDFEVTITLPSTGTGGLDTAQIDLLVAAAKPANVKHRVVVGGSTAQGTAIDEESKQ
jgi:phage tail-like protein